jgi:hypothetical protein
MVSATSGISSWSGTVETIPAQSAPADVVGTSIVFLGVFDPLLLQPAYLAENALLTDSDLAQLRYQFLAAEIAILNLPWMQVVADPTKLMAATTTQSPIVEPVRDFIFALYETLKFRRVTAVGLNHDTHFGVRSEEVWHKVGHALAPKDDLWRRILVEPGTASLLIQGKRDDEFQGNVNVKVEPSALVHPGIYVNVNDHMVLADLDGDRLVKAAGEKLYASKARSDLIVAAIKELAQ